MAHATQLLRWIHEMNPSPDLRKIAVGAVDHAGHVAADDQPGRGGKSSKACDTRLTLPNVGSDQILGLRYGSCKNALLRGHPPVKRARAMFPKRTY